MNKKNIGILIAVLFFINLLSVNVKSSYNENEIIFNYNFIDDEVDQQQIECIDLYYHIHDKQWMAQTFVPSLDIITRVEILLYRWHLDTDYELNVSIRSENLRNVFTSVSKKPFELAGKKYWIMFSKKFLC